jgi:hypothetical protein
MASWRERSFMIMLARRLRSFRIWERIGAWPHRVLVSSASPGGGTPGEQQGESIQVVQGFGAENRPLERQSISTGMGRHKSGFGCRR